MIPLRISCKTSEEDISGGLLVRTDRSMGPVEAMMRPVMVVRMTETIERNIFSRRNAFKLRRTLALRNFEIGSFSDHGRTNGSRPFYA